MRTLVHWIDRASFWLARLASALVVAMTIGFVVALLLQVICRYVLNMPLSWSEELATFLFVWATLLAASAAVRHSEHLRLNFLEETLPKGASFWLGVLCQLLIGIFGLYLVKDGWRLADLVWTNTSAAIGFPLGFLYISVPVTGGIIAVHSVARILLALSDPDRYQPIAGDLQ